MEKETLKPIALKVNKETYERALKLAYKLGWSLSQLAVIGFESYLKRRKA